jgi:hypothetical protein
MRRIIALLGSVALLTGLLAAPVGAAGGPPDGYSIASHSTSASAFWGDCEVDGDTWVCTEAGIFAWDGVENGDDAFPRGQVLCLNLFRHVYDVETEQLLEDESEFGCSTDVDFRVAKGLASASIAGSSEISGYSCVYALGNPDDETCVDIGWHEVSATAELTATAAAEKVKNRVSERSFGPDGKCHFRDTFSGTRRPASAVGSFDGESLGSTSDARIRSGTGSFAEWCS